MSSGSRRAPRGNTTSHPSTESRNPQFSNPAVDETVEPSNSAARRLTGTQSPHAQVQYGPPSQSTPMALQPPLLPSIPPSFGHHRNEFSLDSSSSRTSFPSPRAPHRPLEGQVATPDTSPTWPGRRGSVQKRAFRQRRKDPSCDACRERKVKCDATDSRSCTECANRGVRCQFTKDTNRRMSSIKQVQELERQLGQMRQQNERLKLMLSPADRMELDVPTDSSSLVMSQVAITRPFDYAQIRRNFREHARGIFRPPSSRHNPLRQHAMRLERSSLPDQQESVYLAETCRNSFIKQLSFVEWDGFLDKFRSIYATASSDDIQQAWMALFYTVLAIGSLQNRDHRTTRIERRDRANEFVRRALEYLPLSDENITLEHCRAALLLSVYYVEANQNSAGWTWLSVALSFAFDLGLHDDRGKVNYADSEQRQHLWCSLYSWERWLCLEMSRPLLIDDDDCHITPISASDRSLESNGSSSFLLRNVIPLTRLYGSLRKVTRSPFVSSAALMTFESLLEPISASYPRPMQPTGSSSYDISYFTFTVMVSNASLTLNRQNMNPVCSMEQRSAALEGCASAARMTERCIRDSLIFSGAPDKSIVDYDIRNSNWAAWLRSSASCLFCTHFWRCILVFSFAMDFESAMVCAKASGALGDMRDINVACGRYLVFFLERLLEKIRSGEQHRQSLIEDVEMVAYMSGDLQADIRTSWIWQGAENDTEDASHGVTAAPAVAQSEGAVERSPDEEQVWSNVEGLLQELERERTRQRPLPDFKASGEGSLEREEATQGLSSRPMSPDEGNKRMSIANII